MTPAEPRLYTVTREGTIAKVHVARYDKGAGEQVWLEWRDGKRSRRFYAGTRRRGARP